MKMALCSTQTIRTQTFMFMMSSSFILLIFCDGTGSKEFILFLLSLGADFITKLREKENSEKRRNCCIFHHFFRICFGICFFCVIVIISMLLFFTNSLFLFSFPSQNLYISRILNLISCVCGIPLIVIKKSLLLFCSTKNHHVQYGIGMINSIELT